MTKNVVLKNQECASEFYEKFFQNNTTYLSNWWTPHQLVKIADVISSLNLPKQGDLFDFGCGVGDMTKNLSLIMPEWEVIGSDISSKAIEFAKQKYPGIQFQTADEVHQNYKTFDLIFSHHVFEHVVDVDSIFAEVLQRLKPGGKLLIVVPCGNPGSLEYSIASNTRNGINTAQGNRFYYEASDHQRRLRTEDFQETARKAGCTITHTFYADQFWGGIEWISRNGLGHLNNLIKLENAIDEKSKRELVKAQSLIKIWALLRSPYCKLKFKLRQPRKTIADRVKIMIGLILFPISYPLDQMLWSRVREEWKTRKSDPAGAEIWMVFESSTKTLDPMMD